MADKSSTGAVHLTTLDLDVSKVFEQLNEISEKVKETAEEVRNTPFTFGPSGEGASNPLGDLPENTNQAVKSTKASIESLIGQYLSLEKTITQFRATEDGTNTFKDISVGINDAISKLAGFSEALKNGETLSKESRQEINNLREALVTYSNQVKEADNALLKSGESLDTQKNKFSSLAESYNKFVTSLGKSSFDINYEPFNQLKREAESSASAMQSLYDKVKAGDSISTVQAQQFSQLSRSLSDYKERLSELTLTAQQTGEGLKQVGKAPIDFSKTINSIVALNTQYNNFLTSVEKSKSTLEDSALGDIPKDALAARDELVNLYNEISRTGSVTQEQATRVNELSNSLGLLKSQYSLVKETAQRTGEGLKEAAEKAPDYSKYVKSIESLNLQYKTFQNTLAKSKLDDSVGAPLDTIKSKANEAANSISSLASKVQESGTITKEQVDEFNSLSSTLNSLKGELKDAETNAIETGTGFKTLGDQAKESGNSISDFFVRLADKAKWLMAYQLIMLVQNAFGNVIGVIKGTEDSVVELQRVLNDDTLSSTVISDALYDIAYRYGQTFENVQEAAVLFAQTGKDWNETLQATEATMLALNTAELDTTQATSGLVAVMSQFKLEASELQLVIDKINITADSFPVTSEKIVAALQRVGASASVAGLSLDETIGLITAMSEATGRSGENIGTALNSLIQYTKKAASLKVFAGLSDEMAETVKEFQTGAKTILDVWAGLSNEIKNLSREQQEALFSSQEYQEFADQFEAEAAEYVQSIGEIYGTAGTYRQTYFVSILDNMGAVTEALENMADAEGYSLSENEKYLATLTSQWQKLITVAQELAVQFGNAGFLEFLKFLAQAATGALSLAKELGGINTILIALTGLILRAKWESLSNFFLKSVQAGQQLGSILKGLILNLNFVRNAQLAYNMSIEAGATAAEAFAVAAGTMLGPLTIIASILYAGYSKWNQYKEEMQAAAEAAKQARESLIETGKEAETAGKDLATAVKTLEDAKISGVADDISKATLALLEFLGYDQESIPNLVEQYGDLDTALQKLIETEYEAIKADALRRKEAAEQSFQDLTPYGEIDLSQVSEETNKASKAFYTLVNAGYEANDSMISFGKVTLESLSQVPSSLEDAKNQIDTLNEQINILKTSMTSEELTGNKVYEALVNMRDSIKSVVDEVEDADEFLKLLGDNSSEYFKNLNVAIKESEEVLSEFSGATANIDEKYLKTLNTDIENLGKSFDNLSKKVDAFQKAYYETLPEVLESFNKTGKLTVDQLQTLLEMEPEYLGLIEEKNGKLVISKEKTEELVQANNDYLMQMAAIKLAEEAETIVKEAATLAADGYTDAQIRAKLAAQDLTTGIEAAALAFLKGEDDGTQFRKELENIATQAGLTASQIDIVKGSVDSLSSSFVSGIAAFFKGTFDTSKTTIPQYKPTAKKSSSSSSGKSAAEKALEAEKKAVKELISLHEDEIYFMEKKGAKAEDIASKYKELQEVVHNQADKYRQMGYDDNSELIRELQKSWWKYQEEIEKVISGIYDANVDAYKNAIDQLEFDYDRLNSMLDYSGMTDNLEEQLSYWKKIMQEAENEYARLIAKGMDLNDDAVQSVIKEWRDAYNSIQDINENIADDIIERYDEFISLADSFDVWDKLDVSKLEYLKQELIEVNGLFEDGTITLSKYKDMLESLGKAYLEAGLAELEQKQADVKAHYDDIIAGYNAEIDRIKAQKDASDKYYDGLIDDLNAVEASNERINALLDYYANRQKILRNLEQAQARSGIEWREKEIEYQEELADLDEDWRRTQQDWAISDQIDALEKLKQEAADRFEESIARIEEYIDNAEKESEAAIKAIEDEMEELKWKVYQAITEELEKAKLKAEETKDALANIGDNATPSIQRLESAIESALTTLENGAKQLGDTIANSIASGVERGVASAKSTLQSATNTIGTSSTIKAPSYPSIMKPSTTTSTTSDTTDTTTKNIASSILQGAITPIIDKVKDIVESSSTQKTMKDVVEDTTKGMVEGMANSMTEMVDTAMKQATSQSAVKKATSTGTKNITTTTSNTDTRKTAQTNNNTVNVFANVAQDTSGGVVNGLVNQISNFFTQPFKR